MEMGKLKPATGETDNRTENLRKGVRHLIYHFKMCVLGIYWPVEVSLNLDGTGTSLDVLAPDIPKLIHCL